MRFCRWPAAAHLLRSHRCGRFSRVESVRPRPFSASGRSECQGYENCALPVPSGKTACTANRRLGRCDDCPILNWRRGGIALPRELFLDQNEVVADEIKNLFSREQRDGKSPDLTLVPETWGRESCRPSKTEEAPKILGGGGGNFGWRQVSHSRERARYFGNVGGLVALAAPGLRRKVRSVRLNQNLLEGQFFRNVAKVLSFWIG